MLRNLVAACVIATSLFCACAKAGEQPTTTEEAATGATAKDFISPSVLRPDALRTAKAKELLRRRETDENEVLVREQQYIRPRAWPKTEIDEGMRRKAIAATRQMKGFAREPVRNQKTRPRPNDGPAGQTPKNPAGRSGPRISDIFANPEIIDRLPDGRFDLPTAQCKWSSAGPTNINGRVTSIAIDPNDGTRVFITTVGGVWRSTDSGRRWTRVAEEDVARMFASIAVNPGNGAEIFAGAGDPNYHGGGGGVFVSTSNGDPGTWTKSTPGSMDGLTIYRLRIDPAAPNNIYAATSGGVFLGSRSGGSISWARVASFDAWTNDLAVDFSVSPRIIYAAVRSGSASFGNGVWKYNGTSWSKRDSGIPTASGRTIALALAQSSPNVLYVKLEKGSDGTLQGLYKTTTAGETTGLPAGTNAWSLLPGGSVLNDSLWTGGGYSWYNSMIEVDPSDANVVWASGLKVYRSTNGGTSFVNVAVSPDAAYPSSVHDDNHAVAFDPTNPKIVYLGNDGGIDKTTDTSDANWSWRDIAHGLILTEYYEAGTQWAPASILTGGAQDNGNSITFGNRTWYNPGGCDGFDAQVDAADASTVYANCNGGLYEFVNPVPGTPGGGSTIAWTTPSGINPKAPLMTDPLLAGAALMVGARAVADPPAPAPATWDPQRVLKTTDGVNWTSASTEASGQGAFTFFAIAPSSSFQTYYAGVVDGASATVWRTTNGGGMWLKTTAGLPANMAPNNAAVDYSNANKAFLALGGSAGGAVAVTTDGGANWSTLPGSGAGALPNIPVTSIAIDSWNANVVYAGTSAGVFRGVVAFPASGAPTATWEPFVDGMPVAADISNLYVNPQTDVLVASTYGHGMYQRELSPYANCADKMLVVRDNVFDRGQSPSPSDVPDAEYPVPDPARPGFYKPDDAGRLYWWTSADVKTDVPSAAPAANQIASADHVEFDACPPRLSSCPPGTIIDADPRRAAGAKVYAQVANKGVDPVTNVRVIALWAEATAGLPLLPADFWTMTFPGGGAPCGPLDTSTGWRLANTTSPCKLISSIGPEVPEVAKWDWSVPAGAAEHSCMLVIVESADQPLPSWVRSMNELRPWELVPRNRQISLRNLHIVDSSTPGGTAGGSTGMGVPNPTKDQTPMSLTISRADMYPGGRVIVMLPKAARGRVSDKSLRGLRPVTDFLLTDDTRRMIERDQLDPGLAFEATARQSTISDLLVPPGQSWKIGLVYDSGPGKPNTASRFTVVQRQGSTILGGSDFLLRIKP